MKTNITVSLWTVILVTIAFSQEIKRNHRITIEDYFTQAYIHSCTASPDGKCTAYIESRWNKQRDNRDYDLWIVDNKTKAVKRLTFDPGKKENPQWSPDGKTIYFKGNIKRDGEKNPPYDNSAQIWQIKSDGGEIIPVTHVLKGIDSYKIAGNGSAVYYTVRKDHISDEWQELRNEFKDELDFGHGIHKVSELWKLDITTWYSVKLIGNERFIRYFDVSPDGQRIAMITNPTEHLITHEGQSEVDILNVSTGETEMLPDDLWRAQAPSPYGWLEHPTWSDNGQLLAFSIAFDGYQTELFIAKWGQDKVNIRKVTRPDEITVAGGLQWMPGKETLCVLGDHRARQRIYKINIEDGSSEVLTPGDVVVEKYDLFGHDGSLIALQSTLTYNRDLVFYHSQKKSERLTRLNPQVDTWQLPKISLVQWEGAKGDVVEGILELPPDYDGSSKLPLIVEIHGGPTASRKFRFRFYTAGHTAFASKGYALLAPNYRGSTGYGDAFMTDLIGRENEIDVTDILTGVDALIEKGIADPERLGVMGWSNGGFLTNCLIASNRFKAASSGAGVIDQTIQWGEEDTPGHVINYMQGLPWEKPDAYRNASPVYALHSGIKTAVLIHAGKQDERVPVTHSRTLHRALHYYIKVPCELVLYPDAKHSLLTYTYRLAKMKWDHAWFDKYLLGKNSEDRDQNSE